MPTVNRITIVGHLGQNAETKQLEGGLVVTTFSVATSYKPKNKEPETEWHNITTFGRTAEIMADAKKGDLVYVEGRLRTDKWTDRDGNKKNKTSIVANVAFMTKPRERVDQPPARDEGDEGAPF